MPPKTTTRPKKRKKRDASPENDRNHCTKARKIEAPQIDLPRTQAQPQNVARLPRGLRGPKGIKLKQIQYHKFNEDIPIYHYAASFLSVPNFRSMLNRQQHGYVNYLLGGDPLASTPTPPGDETPPGCLEVGYLPSVFMLGGSALGFRLPSNPPATQWLCFDRDSVAGAAASEEVG
ncbi:hypothetical protein ACET3X_009400 [Alternaria dauci]|uniref:Uncharacterized protein n=1 Tax=Alternaria dauci TaxID=48095 RepID=A0ABR3U8Q4_9PLEO